MSLGKIEGEGECFVALEKACAKPSSQAEFSRLCGVTVQTVNEIIKRKRHIPASIAWQLGYDRVTVYRKRK